MNEISDANKQQQQQQQQQQHQHQQQQQQQQQNGVQIQQEQQAQQVQINHDGSQQAIMQAQQTQGVTASGAQAVTPQALIVNTSNIAQQQQQLQSVSMHQTAGTGQQQMSMQQPQSSLSMQVPQSAGNAMQTSLGSMSIQQPGATTITTMQAPPGSLPQSGANTITTMQAPLGTMAIQQGGQTITTMQAPPGAVPLHTPQSGTTTITTMSTLQQHQQHPIQAQTPQPQQGQIQQVSDWGHGRVQVIQQPIQNPTYLQQLYNTQGQLLMPGNIALHPAGMNPGSIQVIAASKPFQPNQLAPHMLTAQGKQVITQGQPGAFPSYATIPTTTNQTLVISQLGVISSQPNILPHSAKQDMQKLQYTTCQTGRAVQQNTAQPMQFSPWQFGTSLPQGIAWAPQPPTLLTTQNPIFIRGATQQDGTTAPPMFIQSPPPQTIHAQHPQGITTQGTLPNLTQIAASGGTTTVVATKPRNSNDNIQPKGNTAGVARPLSNILPSVPGQQAIRPASSVSTQTGVAQHLTQAQMQNQKAQAYVNCVQAKLRSKPMIRGVLAAGQKADAANQTKPQSISPQQHLAATNKMILTSAGTLVASTQQLAQDKIQQQQQQIQQQKAVQQQQQQQLVSMQQQINIQQQQITYQQQQAQQQLIQPKPPPVMVSGMAVTTLQQQQTQQQAQQQLQIQQQIQQQLQHQQVQQHQQQAQQQQAQPQQPQQITIIDRPVMPVVSMGAMQNQQNQAQVQVTVAPCPVVVKEDVPVQIVDDKSAVASEVGNLPSVDSNQENQESTAAPQNETESGGVAATGEGINGAVAAGGGEGGATPVEEATRERGLPKALVKPQVLTHVIEGFVIQEASEPFPVNRSSLLTELAQSARTEKENRNQLITADEPPLKKQALEGAAISKTDLTKCELCGKMPLRLIFKKGKRFCSTVCAKRYSSNCSKRAGGKAVGNSTTPSTDISDDKKSQYKTDKLAKSKEWGVDQQSTDMDTNDSAASGPESSLSPSEVHDPAGAMDTEDSSTSESANPAAPKVNPLKWTVSDVCEFIRDLPGCCDYAEDFAIQEIDGQALMLLKEDHLMSAMAMKLGPALKICAKIDTMRVDGGGNKPPQQPSPEK